MRWRGRRTSNQVEDRRGRRMGPAGVGGIGCGGLILILAFAFFTGQDPLQLLEIVQGTQVSTQAPVGGSGAAAPGQGGDEMGEFASVVLADTEETWSAIFAANGRRYPLPTLVLFTDAVPSACGFNSSAVGPFYCPADQKIYIDLSFFRELDQRFGAPGDFAQAYVLAHEVGHHVQNQLGISAEVRRRQQGASRSQANELSVRLELQADCLAGVWGYHAHHERQLLETGDVEEGLRAAAAIGDDVMQRRAGASVRPESWTHGSAEQRAYWLQRGLASGDLDRCDTLSERNP